MTHRIVNFVGFQIAWFACILGAANGAPIAGPVVVLVLMIAHLALRRHRLSGELTLLASAAVLGYAMDSMLVVGGALAFPEPARLGGPSTVWMVALWVNLAATLHVSLAWLGRRYVVAAVFGAIGGPVYWAGARFGAVTLGSAPLISLAAVAVEWIIAMPALVWLARATDGSVDVAPYRLTAIAGAEA